MNALLERVKSAGEDFEWYPTTGAMLEVIASDIRNEIGSLHYSDEERRDYSILDIGAGNGNALEMLCKLTKNTTGTRYAIEKSRILIDNLPANVFVIGTDFYQQTLIDKHVDVVFCNPPYSDFETWMRRIVSEANCDLVYMVVPQRWKENRAILDMINRRCDLVEEEDPRWEEEIKRDFRRERGQYQVLESTSFEHSEFRQARAQVDILKIKFKKISRHAPDLWVDPFDIWFEGTFSIDADKTNPTRFGRMENQSAAERLHDLVTGQNVIERLEELYRADFDKLLEVYQALEKMDRALFQELGVDLAKIKEGLKAKIKGLKDLYWKELFSNLDAITSRLTSKSREALLGKLTAHTSIDFTASNAYAVVVWAVKNANEYFDIQLLEVYKELTDQENIRNYKSNTRVLTDNWRFSRKEVSHYTLEYRLVINHWRCFSGNSWDSYGYPNGLSRSVHASLNDLATVAKNLGFDVRTDSLRLRWEAGKLNEFYMVDGTLFMDVRAYKKGTVHIRCNQDFMRKLNIEAGRLNGWIKSPAEAQTETEIENAAELFGSNFKLRSLPLLPEPEEDQEPEALPAPQGEQFELF